MKTIYFDNTKNAKDYAPKLDTIFRYVNSDGTSVLLECVKRRKKNCNRCCLKKKNCEFLVCTGADRQDESDVQFKRMKLNIITKNRPIPLAPEVGETVLVYDCGKWHKLKCVEDNTCDGCSVPAELCDKVICSASERNDEKSVILVEEKEG